MDGKCNEECNNRGCHFDGRDCEPIIEPCNPTFDAYCRKHYKDGNCDVGCNNAGCNWDGLDCENKKLPTIADGMMSVIVLMDETTFRSNLRNFLREVGWECGLEIFFWV